MSYKHGWLRHVKRVVDIKKKGKILYKRAYVEDVDIKNKTIFLVTAEGEDHTITLGDDVTIKNHPEETIFKVNGKVMA